MLAKDSRMKRFMVFEMILCVVLLVGLVIWRHSRSQIDFNPQRIVDAVVAMQPEPPDLRIFVLMFKETGTNKFNVNRYFSVLDALRPEEGFVLDWVYWLNKGHGGAPVLYARRIGSRPFTNFNDYAATFTNAAPEIGQRVPREDDNVFNGYLDRIRAEDSPRGFFQLVVLRLLGDRFLMFWHELYNETMMVCSKEGWEAIVQREKKRGDYYSPPPLNFIATAQKIDFSPRIRMGDKRVEVNVVTYCPFSGLDLHYFAIDRQYPHRITKHTQRNLLRHGQNFVF